MRIETAKTKLETTLSNDKRIEEIIRQVSKKTTEPVQEFYIQKMGDKHMELVSFAMEVIMRQKKRKKNRINK